MLYPPCPKCPYWGVVGVYVHMHAEPPGQADRPDQGRDQGSGELGIGANKVHLVPMGQVRGMVATWPRGMDMPRLVR